MALEEGRIRTLHPDSRKRGINIEAEKYQMIRSAILRNLQEQPQMKFMDLLQNIEEELQDSFDGSINWYVTTIKLDLEARNEIQRVPDRQPQYLRLNPQAN